MSKSLAEFAARTPRKSQIIFLTTYASEKFFSAASVSEGRAPPAESPIGNEIEDFMPASFYTTLCRYPTSAVERMADRLLTNRTSCTPLSVTNWLRLPLQ